MIGLQIQQYKITGKLGAGGMGEVFLADDTKLHRKVALKFLPERLSSDPDFKSRFEHEARAAAALNHPNIITVHDLGEHDGRLYIVMEHVEGQTLGELISENPPSIERALDIVTQICEGLAVAHEAGIVHRDIKPANILLTKDKRVKILDFGLAKSKRATTETRVGSTLGTVQYESPEQSRGDEVDQRSDIFSLGVLLYELITGKLPFIGDYDEAIRYAISHEPAEPLARFKSGVTPELEALVARMLEKDPEMRHQSARGVSSDIKRLRRDSNPIRSSEIRTAPAPSQDTPSMISTPAAQEAPPPSAPPAKAKRSFLIPAAVLTVVVIAALVFKPWKFEVSPNQVAQASEDMLAIMYFDNLKQPDDPERLGEMSTNLLITALSENRDIRVLSSQRLYDILKQLGKAGSKVIDRETASQVADKAKARWMLIGTILQTEPRLVITTQVIDVKTGEVLSSQRSTANTDEDIFGQLDRLTAEIRSDMSLKVTGAEQQKPLRAMTTTSPEAYRLFLKAQEQTYQVLMSQAMENLEKAVELDSTFAMAYCWLSYHGRNAKDNIRQAVKYSSKVGELDRRYILAENDVQNGAIDEAIDGLHAILRDYPEEKLAARLLGDIFSDVRFDIDSTIHYNLLALELDPTFKLSLNDVAYRYKDKREFDKALEYIDRYLALVPNEYNPYDSRGEILMSAGRIEEAKTYFSKALDIMPDIYNSHHALALIAYEAGDYETAINHIQKLTDSRWPRDRALGRWLKGCKLFRQGRFEECLTVFKQGFAADLLDEYTGWTVSDKILQSVVLLGQLGRFEEARNLVDRLVEEGLDKTPNQYGLYIESRLNIFLAEEDYDRALDLVRSAENRMLESGHAITKARFYWHRSIVYRRQGKFELALQDAETASRLNPRGVRTVADYTHGLIYLDQGKASEAIELLGRYVNSIESLSWRVPLWSVEAHYLLGKAYELSGDKQNAIASYEKFLEIWKNADHELESIKDAKVRLAKLTS